MLPLQGDEEEVKLGKGWKNSSPDIYLPGFQY